MEKDLFGNPVTAPPARSARGKRGTTPARGYAARPGTGPKGESCKTCFHKYPNEMRSGRVFWKCQLMQHCWTGGRGSDILMKSPACSRWKGVA